MKELIRKILKEEVDNKTINFDYKSIIEDLLNTFLSFDGKIKYECEKLDEYYDDNIEFYFNIITTIDSSLYHRISPKYDEKYYNFLNYIEDDIFQLIKKYIGDTVSFEYMFYKHDNVDYIVDIVKPLLKSLTESLESRFEEPVVDFKILEVSNRAELVFLFEKLSNKRITITTIELELKKLFNGDYFSDFYMTLIPEIIGDDKIINVYESISKENIICDNCGWSWKIEDSGNDPFTCHKCGNITSKKMIK